MKLSRMINAVDAHACGEPGRVIVGGVSDVPGATMFEKMTYLRDSADDLRRLMLREPRGYPAANCNLLLPPTTPSADAGFVIMEQVEYPPMSGSNTICVATVLIETGMVPVSGPIVELTLETPAGLVKVVAEVENAKVTRVTFRNVPAFAVHLDATIDVPTIGSVLVDVAYGGMFYVIADVDQFGLELVPDQAHELTRVGELVKAAAREQLPVIHPDNDGIAGVTIAVLSGRPTHPEATRKNTVVVSSGSLDWERASTWTGVLDRSPCGTGTSAVMAVRHAKGQLRQGERFVHEGILGTLFEGRVVGEAKVGPYDAVIPEISGTAWITGFAAYVIDDTDPFPTGFTVGDIWGHAVDAPLGVNA